MCYNPLDNTEETDPVKEFRKSHLAGLIDAEGHLSICSHSDSKRNSVSYGVSMAVDNTYFPLMKYLVHHFGGTYRVLKPFCEEFQNRLPMYSWKPESNQHANRIISLVLPYLVLKKERGKLCQKFLQIEGSNPSARQELHKQYVEQIGSLTTNTSHVLEWKTNLVNAYFAGFFDGEGSVGIYKHKQSGYSRCSGYFYKPRITVSNTDWDILKKMQSVYGGGLFSYTRKDDSTRKTAHLWSLNTNKQIEAFVLKMLPYLEIKRDQAKLILEFVRMGKDPNPVLRRQLAKQVRDLKRTKIESDLHSDMQSALAVTQEA